MSATLRSRSNTRPSSASREDSPAERPSTEDKGKGRSNDAGGEGTEYGRYMGLPAVKGTLGGIESPRRGHFPSSSVSTLREIQVSSPTPSNRDQEPSPEGSTDQSQSQPHVERQWQFRIDPTITTTLDSAPFGPSAREELKRLFGV